MLKNYQILNISKSIEAFENEKDIEDKYPEDQDK